MAPVPWLLCLSLRDGRTGLSLPWVASLWLPKRGSQRVCSVQLLCCHTVACAVAGADCLCCIWSLWKAWLGWLWAQRTPTDPVEQHCFGWCREKDAFCLSPPQTPHSTVGKIPLRPWTGPWHVDQTQWVVFIFKSLFAWQITSVCGLQAQASQAFLAQCRYPSGSTGCLPTLLITLNHCFCVLHTMILTYWPEMTRLQIPSPWVENHTPVWSTYPAPQDLATGHMEPGFPASYFPLMSALNGSQISSCSFPWRVVLHWDRHLGWKSLVAGIRTKFPLECLLLINYCMSLLKSEKAQLQCNRLTGAE